VKNKFVQAFVVLFRLEYPEQWPSFFSDLFALLKSSGCMCLPFTAVFNNLFNEIISFIYILSNTATPSGLVIVDMFLRIMASIDQLVINSDAVRSSSEIAHASQIVRYLRSWRK
jgi:hypothetical protein